MLLNFITPSKDMKIHYKLSASALSQRVAYVWQVRSFSYFTQNFYKIPFRKMIIISIGSTILK